MYDVSKLKSPAECRTVMERAKEQGRNDVYLAVLRRFRDLQASEDPLERDTQAAVEAYEQTLLEKHGRRVPATRTRRKLQSKGAEQSIIDWCNLRGARQGFTLLIEKGLAEFTMEALAIKYAERFPPETVSKARAVLAEHGVTFPGLEQREPGDHRDDTREEASDQ